MNRELIGFILALALGAAAVGSGFYIFKDKTFTYAQEADKAIVTTAMSEYYRVYGSWATNTTDLKDERDSEANQVYNALKKTMDETTINENFKVVDLKELKSARVLSGLSKERTFVNLIGSPDIILAVEDVDKDLSWVPEIINGASINFSDFTKLGTIELIANTGEKLQLVSTYAKVGNDLYIGGKPDGAGGSCLLKITYNDATDTVLITNAQDILDSPKEVQSLTYYEGKLSVVYVNQTNQIVMVKKDM